MDVAVFSTALSTAALLVETTSTVRFDVQASAAIADTTWVLPVPGGPVSTRLSPRCTTAKCFTLRFVQGGRLHRQRRADCRSLSRHPHDEAGGRLLPIGAVPQFGELTEE